jgi:hypothetical protein
MQKPKPPLSRIILEGSIGTCPICHSTEERKYYFLFISFGKIIGCINQECDNFKYNKKRTRKLKIKKLNNK